MVVHFRGENFQGDVALQAGVASAVDFTHAARAQSLQMR